MRQRTPTKKPPSQAPNAIRLINQFTHTKGAHAGERFNLRTWQRKILTQLFTTRADGLRQYRTCLLMLPRKNGKTELAAALALYFLLFDGEAGAEVYSAAADREQASLVFNVAVQMIRNDPGLLAACELVESQKRIVHRKSGSVYRAISADAVHSWGFNAHAVVYDELHAAPNRDLWDALATSQGARTQPLLMAITTAGYDRHSILWELYRHAKSVQADPALDPSFLPIIFEADKGDDWASENVWRACNPALEDFRSIEEMRSACARAKQIPAQENAFRRLYLNQWTETADRWVSLDAWDRCQDPDPQSLAGRRCYVGLDLSATTDMTALLGVFPRDSDHGGGYDVRAEFFVPQDTIHARSQRDRVPYEQWQRDGYLTATPGNVVDYDAVRAALKTWAALYDVRQVGYDPWNATDLITRLEKLDGFVCLKVRQGYVTQSPPTKFLETNILSQQIHHDGHPILRWHVGNVAVETDAAGNVKPSKDKSTEKIDGVSALICALDCLTRDHQPAAGIMAEYL